MVQITFPAMRMEGKWFQCMVNPQCVGCLLQIKPKLSRRKKC